MSNPPSSVQTGTSEHILIKFRDNSESDLDFKVKKTTKFIKLVKTYAEKRHHDHRSLRLIKDGFRMEIVSDKSVQDYNLEDGDVVDVAVFQEVDIIKPTSYVYVTTMTLNYGLLSSKRHFEAKQFNFWL